MHHGFACLIKGDDWKVQPQACKISLASDQGSSKQLFAPFLPDFFFHLR